MKGNFLTHPPPIVHFGGPDKPPRLLRDLLLARIEAVPAGGAIAWATYYFRDRALAEALVAASRRGVRVSVQLEGTPRRASANDAVIDLLRGDGFRGRLAVPTAIIPALHPHLHTKIYWFSHPVPTALIGSFNPSGDVPEDPAVLAEIGDQDRGDNLLVELSEPGLAEALGRRAARLTSPLPRLRNAAVLRGRDATITFFPRLGGDGPERTMAGAKQIIGCVSHLKPGALTRRLRREARRGAQVRLLVHDSRRRVPDRGIAELEAAGVDIRRVHHPDDLPMHAKFLLADGVAWFGSFNYNPRSRWLNHELLASSRHPAIVKALADRFSQIARRSA